MYHPRRITNNRTAIHRAAEVKTPHRRSKMLGSGSPSCPPNCALYHCLYLRREPCAGEPAII